MKKPVKKWRRVVKRIVIWLIVLVLLAAAVTFAIRSLKKEYTVTYQSYTASIGSISNSLSFSGSFALVNSSSYTASSAATVRNIYVTAGQDVKEGEKLMRLSSGETLKADFDGRINTLSVSEGDEVAAGAALMQLADFTHMKVTVRVDEYDISSVAVGDACTITATATEQTYTSTIDSIDYISASGGSVAYYSASINVDVEGGIYPGMQATVSVPQEEANDVVILKADALSFDAANAAYVWMYNDAGELEQVSVEVGVSNGNYTEIKSGLADGDEVYVEVEETDSTDGLGGLLSGIFGSTNTQSNPMGGFDRANFDMGNFDASNMPADFGGAAGGTAGSGRPSGMGGGN